MMNRALIPSLLLALAATALAAETPERFGAFELTLDPANALLPSSLRWLRDGGSVELLDAKNGLNLSFTDFEFRNKFYREENKHVWSDKAEPRFVTEPARVTRTPALVKEGDWTGVEVTYKASYTEVRRRLLFHATEPRLRMEYHLVINRELVIQECNMLGLGLVFDPGFTNKSVPDARAADGSWLTAERIRPTWDLALLNGGPAAFINSAAKTCVLVSGQAPATMPTRMLRLKSGDKLDLSVELRCFAQDDAALAKARQDAAKTVSDAQRPFALLQTAQILLHQEKRPEAEKALLQAAELDAVYAMPYTLLAQMRSGPDASTYPAPSGAPANASEAWAEAAYRMPYNYGYILSGSGFVNDKRLTEAQRRLAIFNMLIAVDNSLFYPDYYVWAARPFEQMKLYAQACAMYRQGLWAIDHMPRPPEFREKTRKQFEAKIAEFEKKLLGEPTADLPPLIPVRPEGAAAGKP